MNTESPSKILNIMSGAMEGVYYGLILGTLIFSISLATGGLGLVAMLGISVGVSVIGGALGGFKGYLDDKESREDAEKNQVNQVLLTRIADNLDVLRESAVRENRYFELPASHALIMSQLDMKVDVDSKESSLEQTVILYQDLAQEAAGSLPSNQAVVLSEETSDSSHRLVNIAVRL